MKKTRIALAGAVAALALTAAAAGLAQSSGGIHMAMGQHHGAMTGVDHAARVDAHLTELKAQLQIAPAQETAWQTFAGAAKQQAQSMAAMHGSAQQARAGSAPERMTQHTAAMQQRLAGMTAMTNAVTSLYAVLTPEQKAVADQHFNAMHQHGKHSGAHQG